jgi:hypothetical protein
VVESGGEVATKVGATVGLALDLIPHSSVRH